MNEVTRYVLIASGTICLVLGLVGIIVPLLPTTPLLLLAAYCYGKSSKHLYDWLIKNRLLGKYILQFQKDGGIPLRTKIVVVTILWISAIYTIFFVIPFLVGKVIMGLVVVSVSYYILSRKTAN